MVDGKRDKCVRKDILSTRNKERIDIIGDLVLELWKELRLNNVNIGFIYVIDKVSRDANSREEDAFFWEEDIWYDFLKGEIEKAKKLQPDVIQPKDSDEEKMESIIAAFKKYWLTYQDLRFQQIIDSIEEDFSDYINGFYGACDSDLYQRFFNTAILNKLQLNLNTLEVAKQRKQEEATSNDFTEIFYEGNYKEDLDRLEEETKGKIDELKKNLFNENEESEDE